MAPAPSLISKMPQTITVSYFSHKIIFLNSKRNQYKNCLNSYGTPLTTFACFKKLDWYYNIGGGTASKL
jgi:hypothetical protein